MEIFGTNNNALIAIAVGRLPPTRLGASAVLAGIDPAIHAAPPPETAPAAPDSGKGLRSNGL